MTTTDDALDPLSRRARDVQALRILIDGQRERLRRVECEVAQLRAERLALAAEVAALREVCERRS